MTISADQPAELSRSIGAASLRNRVAVWRDDQGLRIVDVEGPRAVVTDWSVDRIDLTDDGRYLLAFGDSHRRAQVWETRTGARLLTLAGGDRRHSLHGGIVQIGDTPYVLSAVRDKKMSITDVGSGAVHGWLSTTASSWFQVDRVIGLGPDWLAVLGHREGEQYDTVIALPAKAALDDSQAIMMALSQAPTVREWGYRVAIGPAGPASAVIYRDAEWEAADLPDDADEAFQGLELWDLPTATIVQRMPLAAVVPNGTNIGATEELVAIEMGDHVEVIVRSTGERCSVAAVALDPHRMEVAQVVGGAIVITKL